MRMNKQIDVTSGPFGFTAYGRVPWVSWLVRKIKSGNTFKGCAVVTGDVGEPSGLSKS